MPVCLLGALGLLGASLCMWVPRRGIPECHVPPRGVSADESQRGYRGRVLKQPSVQAIPSEDQCIVGQFEIGLIVDVVRDDQTSIIETFQDLSYTVLFGRIRGVELAARHAASSELA